MKGYITKTQAAERLGCGSRSIDKWIEEGLLESIKTSLNATQQTTLISLPSIELWEQKRDDLSALKAKIDEKEDFLSKIDAELNSTINEYESSSVFLQALNILLRNDNDFWIDKTSATDKEINLYKDFLESNGNWKYIANKNNLSERTIKMRIATAISNMGQQLKDFVLRLQHDNEELKQENDMLKMDNLQLQDKVNAYQKVIKDYHLRSIAPIKTLLTTKVSELPFDPRVTYVLKIKNIKYVYELVQLTKQDILFIRNSGQKTLKQIENWLTEHSLSLGTTFSTIELDTLNALTQNN